MKCHLFASCACAGREAIASADVIAARRRLTASGASPAFPSSVMMQSERKPLWHTSKKKVKPRAVDADAESGDQVVDNLQDSGKHHVRLRVI